MLTVDHHRIDGLHVAEIAQVGQRDGLGRIVRVAAPGPQLRELRAIVVLHLVGQDEALQHRIVVH